MGRRVPQAVGILSLALAASGTSAADLLIRNARLIDGTGAPPRSGMSILVQDGRIAAVGPDVTASGIAVLEADGGTVIPGLIDAHVHLAVVPGAALRHDPSEVLRSLRRAHLRAYLACGVTTVLDTGIDVETALEIRAWLAAGHAGPRFLTLGPPFVTPGGYLADQQAAVATPADVEAHFERVEAAGAIGVKIFVERGFGPWPVWPIPSAEVRAAIVRGAARRHLPLYVHANREDDKLVALDMGAHAIAHASFYHAPPSPAFVARLSASGAYVMTTFAIMDAPLAQYEPERLDDPLVRRTVPDLELSTARDPDAGSMLAQRQIAMTLPWLPPLLQGPVASVFLSATALRRAVRRSEAAVHTFWKAGVPIVIGSDAGNWPVVAYQFHGPTTLREIQLLREAGLPPDAVLAAATRVPARMLGLDGEIGTVEPGKHADLVVLRKDPLRSLRALRTIRFVVHDGVGRTPAGWLRESADRAGDADRRGARMSISVAVIPRLSER